MPHYKNTLVTNLTELVIDGRTKQIQWILYLKDENRSELDGNNGIWVRNDFKHNLQFQDNDKIRNMTLSGILNMLWPIEVAPHAHIVKLTKFYDQNPRKYDTWISGGTFNVRVKRKPRFPLSKPHPTEDHYESV